MKTISILVQIRMICKNVSCTKVAFSRNRTGFLRALYPFGKLLGRLSTAQGWREARPTPQGGIQL